MSTIQESSKTLREQITSGLRQKIIDGVFQPGARLVERHMCDMFKVSRTLIREALRQLEAEGWVRILPNRGPIVATMTPDEVRELYEVRAALEGMAALRAAELASPDQLNGLDRVVAVMVSAQRHGDSAAHSMQVHKFYELLREAAGNRLLSAQLTAMSARLSWLRGFTLAQPERAAIAVQEEVQLLEALKARDGARARLLCEAHLRATGEAAVTALEARGGENSRSRAR
jgi:GntR family transcriptional regulator, trigonelline degradation regulator